MKKKIVKAVIWSMLLYGSVIWKVNADIIQRVEAFEILVGRRLERMSWIEKDQ